MQISNIYHAWRGQSDSIERRGAYKDISGLCYSASLEDIKSHGYVLIPGRFVGADDELTDDVPFEEKFESLRAKLTEQFHKGSKLDNTILKTLQNID